MAEFKISRIRFTWRGNWVIGAEYNRDDVIGYAGSSWVCVRQHTAAIFANDQLFLSNINDSEPSPAWKKMTDGVTFRGNWAQSTRYTPGEIVRYGGVLYLNILSYQSTSVFDDNIANWAVYSIGIDWDSNWITSTRYGIGDLVRHGGIVYRCIQGHQSQSTFEADQGKWSTYFQGIEFKGNYQSAVRYKVNDLVLYNGTLLSCVEGYTSSGALDDTKWTIKLLGSEFDQDWSSTAFYGIGSVVRNGGYLFYALQANNNKPPINSFYQPDTSNLYWQVISKGINYRGIWLPNESYKTGDVVLRGGYLYVALLDSNSDQSTLDYLDDSNWEILTTGQSWKNIWTTDTLYSTGDVVVFLGSTYSANTNHIASIENYPGDNGSGFFYWDLVLQAGTDAGLLSAGDLLTYGLSRSLTNDNSTFGPAAVTIGNPDTLLSIDNDSKLEYRNFNPVSRVFFVSPNGIDDITNSRRGLELDIPWKTIRFACERADDGFTGTTTIRVMPGVFRETLPIIVPKRTVVLGSELRSTTITAAGPVEELALDSTYTIAVLNRISSIIEDVIMSTTAPRSMGNTAEQITTKTVTTVVPANPPVLDPLTGQNSVVEVITEVPVIGDLSAVSRVQQLVIDIREYINFYVNSTGNQPVLTGSNFPLTSQTYLDSVYLLEANKDFLADEAVAYMQLSYPSYSFDPDACKRDIKAYIDAWKHDIIYVGNYKSLLAARYYRNAVLGSATEDMFYLRDSTGVRNCTLTGLEGTLNPPGVFDLYQRPTGGSFCSLDPGWGPSHEECWILTRSPYIQGVTTIGTNCVGQKIDGSLHNGGNKSMVSNDFTQVLSDGIGAWVSNNGRAELVSVFTYYCAIGYLAEEGGIIRGTNGNCSYGQYGAIADGVDLTETPATAVNYTRAQQAIVASAFAGDFVDEIQILEWTNAGQNYTQATASFVGAGIDAEVIFEDFRDDAVFEARRLDANSSGLLQTIGGGGYIVVQNNAQAGDLTSITIASNDDQEEAEYLGMRMIITSGAGTGQYGYITAYNTNTKVVSISKETTDQPGWDHVRSGFPISSVLNTTTTYRIEPRVIFSAPAYSVEQITVPVTTTWGGVVYGETTEIYNNLTAGAGTGTVNGQDGLVPEDAIFNVVKRGRDYELTIVDGGAGYAIGDTLIIAGDLLGGETPSNDLIILVTEVSNDSTNSILMAQERTYGTGEDNQPASGRFVAVSTGGIAALYSSDGDTWEEAFMPSSGDWTCLAAGNNRFVAIRSGSAVAASSLTGRTWLQRTMPYSRNWSSVIYADGIFFAVARNLNSAAYSLDGFAWSAVTMPSAGDSTFNEWVDIAYGKGKFAVLANSSNLVAIGTWNLETTSFSWDVKTMDTIDDSSQKDWVSIAYGNDRFVAISSTGEVAYSFDTSLWYPATLPSQDGSTAHNWKRIKYAQGVFFAVGDTGSRDIGADPTVVESLYAANSYDGVLWTGRELGSLEQWNSLAFGNPYIDSKDSTVGKKTPTWVIVPSNASNKFSKVHTGARALGRAIVSAGQIAEIRLWDPGSGYSEGPSISLVDPNTTSNVVVECRTADGVLSNPSWVNRGLGYRTNSTRVTITGNGFSDVIPSGKFIVINDLDAYPGPGAQLTIGNLPDIYTLVTVTPIGQTDRGLAARIRVSPEIKVRDNLEHLTPISIRTRYSQVRITGHDFLDIGTGNFEQTNYPELYSGLFNSAPENEVYEEDGGRVFYTSTDQTGNFRTGELFAVEQATGIVTISADFFDLSGLTELRLGGIRVGGTGAVVREFSTDAVFTEDSNNVVPTQRAIRAYLNNRLTVGGSEIATASFIAGTVKVGPDTISNVASLKVIIPVMADFDGPNAGISGSMLAQTMFYRSFK